jgi:quinoprotein glucose dehydrogenase
MLLALLLLAPQDPFAEAERSKGKFKLGAGLSIELYSAEPHFVNPVAFHADEKGRFYVVETHRLGNATFDIRGRGAWVDDDLACRTVADREAMHRKFMGEKYEKLTDSERVRLVEDTDGDGRADKATTFAENFGTPADGIASGVLARKGEVWFANIPNLWKLKDSDGDGKADVRTSLHYGYGVRLAFIGHDLHGLTFGPDGKLYFSCGDRGLHVKQGDRAVSNPDSGAVLRCDPDGSNLEIFCTGLRNPQELCFDDFGNLWTGDNNCDAGDKARWTYLMEGGDVGWRIGYQQAPGRGPWMAERLWELDAWKTAPSQLPPIAHIGHGPSGLTFNPGGAALPAAYDGHFFMCNFPGNVLAWTVKPKGAGFEVQNLREILSNVWPTDVDFAPDGGLYVSDWVDGWGMPGKGRLWRLWDPARAADAKAVKTLLGEGMEKRTSDELSKLLGHPDRRARQAAQFELAGRGTSSAAVFAAAAEKGNTLFRRLHALWGAGQVKALGVPFAHLADEDPEVRAQAARIIGDGRHAMSLGALLDLLKDPSLRVRGFAAMALGKLGKAEAVGPILVMLRGNEDAHLRHAGVIGLAWIGDAAALAARAKDEAVSVRLAVLLALRRLGRAEVAAFLDDPDLSIVLEAARAINDAPVNAAMPALAGLLGKPGLSERIQVRAINAAFRTGQAAALAAFAERGDVGEAARAEALKALADWEKPSGRDRVLHVWRPLDPRDPGPARGAVEERLGALLSGTPAPVRVEALRAALALGAKDVGREASALALDRKAPGAARAEALKALARLKDPALAAAVAAGLSDPDGGVRKEATRLAGQARIANAAALLEELVTKAGPVETRQAALGALADLPEGEAILGRFLAQASFPAALRLDLLEAAARKPKLPKVEATWNDCLEGGDADAGRRIFFERADANCARCHKIGGKGGEVGPALPTPAMKKGRAYVLESLTRPNAVIAEGFGQTLLQMEGGAVETGRIEKESDAEIVLILPDGTRKSLAKKDVRARKAGLSAMPEDALKALNKREVRDVVEYLAGLP